MQLIFRLDDVFLCEIGQFEGGTTFKIHRVIERRDPGGNIYTAEPLHGQGGLKMVNRTELLDTRAKALMDVDALAEGMTDQ